MQKFIAPFLFISFSNNSGDRLVFRKTNNDDNFFNVGFQRDKENLSVEKNTV